MNKLIIELIIVFLGAVLSLLGISSKIHLSTNKMEVKICRSEDSEECSEEDLEEEDLGEESYKQEEEVEDVPEPTSDS